MPLDYAALFAATPTPYLVLTPDLIIQDANQAYLEATGRTREELVGRWMFDAFPEAPTDPHGDGVPNLRASMERARDSGETDTMGVQRYDIPIAGTDDFDVRYWSPINVPIPGDGEGTVLLLHRAEDVTAFVRARQRQAWPSEGMLERRRVEAAESELFARARGLEKLNRELREAGDRAREVALTLQRALLPSPRLDVAGLEVAVRYQPAEDALRIGGDWYDVVEVAPGCVSVAVGDVVGKGLGAAAVMGQLRSGLSGATYNADDPAQALEVLDRYARTLDGALGTTVVQVRIDAQAELLRYTRAGHLPPLLVGPSGRGRFLMEATGPPLAAHQAGWPRPKATAAFPIGSTLVLYTDGLVERRGRDLDAGLQALADAVSRNGVLDVESLADAVLRELLGGDHVVDDTALVIARATAEGAPG